MEHVKKEATCIRDNTTGQCYELVDEKARKRLDDIEKNKDLKNQKIFLNDVEQTEEVVEFYAPETAGSDSEILVSLNGKPTWVKLVHRLNGFTFNNTVQTVAGYKSIGGTNMIYAPTTGGSKGQVLISNGEGAPIWGDVSTGSSLPICCICQIPVSVNTNKQETFNWSSIKEGTPITGQYVIFSNGIGVVNTVNNGVNFTATIKAYYRVSLNGKISTQSLFYAPTEVGTKGQVLISNGEGAPIWGDMPTAGEVTKQTITLTDSDAIISLPDGSNRFTVVYNVPDNTHATILLNDNMLDVQLNEGTTTLHIEVRVGKNSSFNIAIDSSILGEDSTRSWEVIVSLSREGAYPINPTTSLCNLYGDREAKYSSLGYMNVALYNCQYIGIAVEGYSYGPFIALDIIGEF